MMVWKIVEPHDLEDLGMLPEIFHSEDTRTLAEQANANYSHGGGWRPQAGWRFDSNTGKAFYPGDPPLQAWAVAEVNGEILLVFPHDYVMILQADGSFEMARLD